METAASGKTAVLGKVYTLIKILVGQKARRQAPPLPHGSYATGMTVAGEMIVERIMRS